MINCNYYLTHQLKHMFIVLKTPSHQDHSFEYPQHMFCLRYEMNNFQLSTLIWGPGIISNPYKIRVKHLRWINSFNDFTCRSLRNIQEKKGCRPLIEIFI